jgi:hypothetical protein
MIQPGTIWHSYGYNSITAEIVKTEKEETDTRVYFTVSTRPGETLDCYAGAFLQRYVKAPTDSGRVEHSSRHTVWRK